LGVRGALHHHIDTRPGELSRFFLGGALVHDLLFAPVVLAAGVLVARLVPPGWRAAVQGSLFVGGVTVLFAYPEIRGYAHRLHNPTSLPHNYTANTAIVLAVVVTVTLLLAVGSRRRRARQGGGRP